MKAIIFYSYVQPNMYSYTAKRKETEYNKTLFVRDKYFRNIFIINNVLKQIVRDIEKRLYLMK